MLRDHVATLLLGLSGVAANAAPAVIGQASAQGPLTVNHAVVWGNATLMEGAPVETKGATGELTLRNGVRMLLASESRVVVGQNRAVLEKGASQVNASRPYEVQARGLRITAEGGARMVVAFQAPDKVDVTALAGKASVADSQGLLLAAIPQGRSVAFAMPQQAAAGAANVTRTGCLLYKDMHFILQDDATTEVIELNGANFAPNTGNRVRITGVPLSSKPSVSIATGVLNVSNVAPVSTGGCLAAAQALDASAQAPATAASASAPKAPAPAHTGLSTGAKAGIIIAIAGGGAGAGIAVLESKKSSTSH